MDLRFPEPSSCKTKGLKIEVFLLFLDVEALILTKSIR